MIRGIKLLLGNGRRCLEEQKGATGPGFLLGTLVPLLKPWPQPSGSAVRVRSPELEASRVSPALAGIDHNLRLSRSQSEPFPPLARGSTLPPVRLSLAGSVSLLLTE